jgi:hypothetical protein
MSTVLGLVLALVCVAVGIVLGGAVVQLGHLAGKVRQLETPPVPAEPSTVKVTAAMGADMLARSAGLLSHLDPSYVRAYVDEMKDPALLQLHVLAAMDLLGSSPEFLRQAQAVADQWMAAESWNMPVAEPDR